MFPGDDDFVENVRQEAIENVKRLRNHPSVCLWCGNNEIVEGWERWGWKEKELAVSQEHADRLWGHYTRLFHDVLGEVVAEHDPTRSYWSSSPTVEPGVAPNLTHGDQHYWGVWHQKLPYESYATNVGRFMSEYGFQSFPELRTVKEYALPEDFGLLTDVMKAHQRSPVGNECIEHYMLQSYRKPKNFEEFLYVGHVLQAELIKYAIEAHRRAMPYCMGTLYWQLHDCWPVASWSSMDSSLRWKAQQYFVKKAYEPLIISLFEQDGRLQLHIVNDHLDAIEGELNIRLLSFSGEIKLEKSMVVKVPGNSSDVHYEADVKDLLNGHGENQNLLVSEFISSAGMTSRSIYYFCKVKELELPKPCINYSIVESKTGYDIVLTSKQLAKNLYLTLGDEDGFFSDNYFDLLPMEGIVVSLQTSISLEALTQVLKLRTIGDGRSSLGCL
jgi:beta-mannosidase